MTEKDSKNKGNATSSNTVNSNKISSNNRRGGGPKTPGGKARSSKNARKEGFFSRELPISEVDRPLYDKIRADLRRQLRPDTPVKEIAFENIVACLWRCVLASRVEGKRMNALLADEAAAQAEDAGPDLNTISWFGASRMALNTANRLLTRIEAKMRNEVTLADEEKQMLARAFGSNFVEVLDIWPDVKTLQQMKIDLLITEQTKNFGWDRPPGFENPASVAVDPTRVKDMVFAFVAERKSFLEGVLKLQEQSWIAARLASNSEFNPRFYASAVKDLQKAFDWYFELVEKGL